MGKRGTRLVAPDMNEVSGVDHPAHMAEGWLVFKAADAPELTDEELAALLEDPDDDLGDDADDGTDNGGDDGVADAALAQELEAVRAELATEKARSAAIEQAVTKAGGTVPVDDPAVQSAVAKARADAQEEAEFQKAVAGMPAETRAYFEKQRAEVRRARDQAAEEHNIRVGREYVEKARREFSGVATSPETLGTVLRQMDERLPAEAVAEVHRLIKSAAAVQQFQAIGAFGAAPEPDSAEAKVEAKVAELRQANPEMSRAQAFVKARELNPELARAYTAEMQGRG